MNYLGKQSGQDWYSLAQWSMLSVILVCFVALSGCGAGELPVTEFNGEGVEIEHSEVVELESVYSTSTDSTGWVDLCTLVTKSHAGAGAYRVIRLVAYPELRPGYSYAHLELIDEWTDDAPKWPVVEQASGPTEDGSWRHSSLTESLELDEVIGAVFSHEGSGLAPYYNSRFFFTSWGVFKESDRGGYTNGMYPRVPLEEIKDAVQNLISEIENGTACQAEED